MACEIVTAIYQPKKGQGPALEALIKAHVPALRRLGLATDRRSIVMRSFVDGSILEIFEWASHEAARTAHAEPEVEALWGKMGEVARFITPAELMESTRTFPHFQPVDESAPERQLPAERVQWDRSLTSGMPRPSITVGANGFDRTVVRMGGVSGTQDDPVNTFLETTVANSNYAYAA